MASTGPFGEWVGKLKMSWKYIFWIRNLNEHQSQNANGIQQELIWYLCFGIPEPKWMQMQKLGHMDAIHPSISPRDVCVSKRGCSTRPSVEIACSSNMLRPTETPPRHPPTHPLTHPPTRAPTYPPTCANLLVPEICDAVLFAVVLLPRPSCTLIRAALPFAGLPTASGFLDACSLGVQRSV